MRAIFKDAVVVKRYGEAYFGMLKRASDFTRAVQECRNLKSLIRADQRFMHFLLSPEITDSDKGNFIDTVLGDDFSSDTKNFLKYLLQKERIDKTENILEYLTFSYAHEGEINVLLRTAYPLDLDVLSGLEQRLSKKFERKLRFYIELDGSLLGGVQVTIGNKVIDGSLRKKLSELEETLYSTGVYVNGTEA